MTKPFSILLLRELIEPVDACTHVLSVEVNYKTRYVNLQLIDELALGTLLPIKTNGIEIETITAYI